MSAMAAEGALKLELGPRATAKALLHALKHASSPVLGVLVAAGEPEEEPSAPGAAGPVVVDDAWALLHSPLACVPTLELALIQVTATASLSAGIPAGISGSNL